MPFDGSGNFSRVYDWTDDRDNGIKIRADRMDGEFDDMAAAFNVVFFRNGLVPMSGDLAMGANDITGIGSGTPAAPSIQFSVDPNTGFFLDGAGSIGFSANGVTRLNINTSGAVVTGSLNVSGASTLTGNTTVGGTLGVTGVTTLTSATILGNFTLKDAGGSAAAMTRWISFKDGGDVERGWAGFGGGTALFSITNTIGNVNLAASAVTINGNTAWHAGNDGAGSGLDADLLDGVQGAAFALLAGATFTGAVKATGLRVYSTLPSVDLYAADNATRKGYMQFDGTNVVIAADTGVVNLYPFAAVSGNTIWHAGNDGAGSGLDADLLDGNQAAAFATLAGSPTFSAGLQTTYAIATNAESFRAANDSSFISFYNTAQTSRRGYVTNTGLVNEVAGSNLNLNTAGGGVVLINGSTVWHAGNDGAGSGLDADLLDGAQGSAYALLAGATFSGNVGIGVAPSNTLHIQDAVGSTTFRITDDGANVIALMGSGAGLITGTGLGFALRASAGMYFSGNGNANHFSIDSTGAVKVGTSTVWHAGNDGSGSGLDADLLDGSHASAFALLAGATFTGAVNVQNSFILKDPSGTASVMNRWVSVKDGADVERGWFGFGTGDTLFSLTNTIGAINLSASAVNIVGNTVWHAGNDGAGSGLDADLLDGLQGIEYRRLPRSTTATTATTGDIGKCIAVSAGITIPNATFAAGDALTIYNDSAAAVTITQAASLTLRQAGTTNTGNRTLAARGIATVWFNGASEAIISGSGLT